MAFVSVNVNLGRCKSRGEELEGLVCYRRFGTVSEGDLRRYGHHHDIEDGGGEKSSCSRGSVTLRNGFDV